MKNYLLLLLLLFIASVELFSQDTYFQTRREENLAEANDFFDSFNYARAIESYKKALMDEEGNIEIKLRIAECYFKLNKAEAAIFWYNGVLASAVNRIKVPVYHLFNYAEALEQNKKYDEALKWYYLYKARDPKDQRATKKIETISHRSSLFVDSMRYEIKALEFNSPYSDFAPSFYEDGIVFASAREEVSKRKKYSYTNSAYLDLYYTKFQDSVLVDAFQFSSNLNHDLHEGSAVFYDNYRKVIFTRNVENLIRLEDGNKTEDELLLHLFYAEKNNDDEWSNPVPLAINEELYSMGHPAISKNGKTLYFISNIPGSYGGTDIYVSHWVNGAWSRPENLGPDINTSGNEMFPFVHSDSILYFSSNGYGGLGGLDIFKVSLKGNKKVQNVGYPLNTQHDDFSIIVSDDGKMGYFASNRSHENDDDVYQFFVKDLPVKNEVRSIEKKIPVKVVAAEIKKTESKPEVKPEIEMPKEEVCYTVQVLALSRPAKKSFPAKLKGAMLRHNYEGGVHRYSYGIYNNSEEAKLLLDQIRAEGYIDAFIRKVER